MDTPLPVGYYYTSRRLPALSIFDAIRIFSGLLVHAFEFQTNWGEQIAEITAE